MIAGSIAPLEECYSPELSPPASEAAAEHARLAQQLADTGADFLLIETMPLIAEALVATEAALATGLEVAVGFVLGEDGRTLNGETLAEVVAALEPYPISALVVNCTPPAVITRAIAELATLTKWPLGAYANLGVVEELVGWAADETMTGERYAPHALAWLDAGAMLVGGCCGTRPVHIAAVRRAMDARG